MRAKEVRELTYGDVVCDTHYGINVTSIQGAWVKSKVSVDTKFGAEFINRTIGDKLDDEFYNSYTNKLLVIIGEDIYSGDLIAAASYDGRRLTIVTIAFNPVVESPKYDPLKEN